MCPVVEVITRTFTVDYTDCGYTPTCNQTITIEDNTPPDIVCPPDQTIEWAVGFNTTLLGQTPHKTRASTLPLPACRWPVTVAASVSALTNCTTIAGPVTNLNYDALGLISTNFVVNGVRPSRPPLPVCTRFA
ncbi:MAG: hypothetical protein R2788_20625 [Saprospiraceae bacterium]